MRKAFRSRHQGARRARFRAYLPGPLGRGYGAAEAGGSAYRGARVYVCAGVLCTVYATQA